VSEQKTAKEIIKKLLFGGYIAALIVIGIQLFFGDQIMFLVNSLKSDQETQICSEDKLIIGYAFAPESLDPLQFTPVARTHIKDIYEGLVRTDRNLKIEPAIAVSWGMTESTVWEFRLRPEVIFHNGKTLTPEDIVNSIEKAMNDSTSQLKNLLGTIEKVEAVSDDRIQITTKVPDPLLLNKLAVTYIFPRDYFDLSRPVGTGPYSFVSREGDELKLTRFENYWGLLPYYRDVVLKSIPNRRGRIDALEDGSIDILVNVPPNVACSVTEKYSDADGCMSLDAEGLKIKSIPSLEVSFLIFNFENELFQDKTIRENVRKALDPQFFIDTAFGFARPSGQYVSSGVFGFNPEIDNVIYNIGDAVNVIGKRFEESFERVSVIFDYPEGLDALAYYIQDQFHEFGVDVELNPLDGVDLRQKINDGDSDFYFLGWRSEIGDAGDFLEAVAHSRQTRKQLGLYNGGNYANSEVDKLIEDSQREMDAEERLRLMQYAMHIITEDDVIGVPLFESETIFAFREYVNFEPRVDGLVFASEIK
jgi:peptide/nickel transport system substrate-binding protein